MACERQDYPYDLKDIYVPQWATQFSVSPEPYKFMLSVGLTNRCNYACPFCYYHASQGSALTQDLPLAILEQVLNSCPPLQCVNFALEGEPLCHPQFWAAVDLAAQHAHSVALSTNASLLNKSLLSKLSAYTFSLITLSLAGSDKESYARFNCGGSFTRFMRNATDAVQTFGDVVCLHSVLMAQNLQAAERLPEVAAQIGVSTLSLACLREHPGARAQGITAASDEDLLRCLDKICESAQRLKLNVYFDGQLSKPSFKQWFAAHGLTLPTDLSCHLPWYFASLLSSGKLFPCCGDFQPQSAELSFDGIFNHPYLRMLRGHLQAGHVVEACVK